MFIDRYTDVFKSLINSYVSHVDSNFKVLRYFRVELFCLTLMHFVCRHEERSLRRMFFFVALRPNAVHGLLILEVS